MCKCIYKRNYFIVGCKPYLDEIKRLLRAFYSNCLILGDASDTKYITIQALPLREFCLHEVYSNVKAANTTSAKINLGNEAVADMLNFTIYMIILILRDFLITI